MHRWRILVAAMAGTAMLAAGFGIAADRLTVPAAPPTPHLQSISDANISASYGVTLSGATQPPYCGLEQAVARAGWLKPGAAGCAISREAAESAAVHGGAGSVVESLLARISSSSNADVHNRLAWLVVVRGTPALAQPLPFVCAAPCPVPSCAVGGTAAGLAVGATCVRFAQRWPDRVVFLDAYSGQFLLPYRQFALSPPVVVTPSRTQRG